MAADADSDAIDGRALADSYETLRRGAMQPNAARHDLRGVALLMRQGMAAWMRCVRQPPKPSHGALHTAAAASRAEPRPSLIEQMLVNIVAAMALSHVAEEINA